MILTWYAHHNMKKVVYVILSHMKKVVYVILSHMKKVVYVILSQSISALVS